METSSLKNPMSFPSPSPSHDFVVQTFYMLLFPMKWVGIYPVNIEQRGKLYRAPTLGTLGTPPTQGTTLYCMLTAVWVIGCVGIYTLNRGFDVPWPIRLWDPLRPQEIFDSSTGKPPPPYFFIWVTLSLQIMIPSFTLVYGYLGFFYISDYCRFLNRWTDFSKLLDIYFSPYSFSAKFTDLQQYRNFYLGVIVLPTLMLSLLIIPFVARTKVLQIADGSFSSLGTIITIIWVGAIMFIRMICTVKDVLNLHILRIAYRELRKGADAQYTMLQGKVNKFQVRNWLKMVTFIREQRTLVERHMGFQNNWQLVEIFVMTLLVLTASVVVVMHDINEYLQWVGTYVAVSIACIFFLFYKGQLAEGISEEEEMFAERIVGMTGSNNYNTRLEMKSLCDLIFHDPIKITLGYVFVLNKQLILSFCGQLATSLVILLQFINHNY